MRLLQVAFPRNSEMEISVYQDMLVNALGNHCCEGVRAAVLVKGRGNLGEVESRFRYKCVTNLEGNSWS